MALLLIDVINAMDFPEGPQLARHARPAAKHIAALDTECCRRPESTSAGFGARGEPHGRDLTARVRAVNTAISTVWLLLSSAA